MFDFIAICCTSFVHACQNIKSKQASHFCLCNIRFSPIPILHTEIAFHTRSFFCVCVHFKNKPAKLILKDVKENGGRFLDGYDRIC